MSKQNSRVHHVSDDHLCGSVGTTHRFSNNMRKPANRARSDIRTLAWWWKLSKIMSHLKVSSLDSVVYELVDALILSIIFSSVLGVNRVIGSVLFTLRNI